MEDGQRLLERILDGAEDPTDLPRALLQYITNDFSEENKIGEGGFGAVYKGVFGERIVAMKRIHINENTFDDRLFRLEFVSLWKTNLRNVVRFLGFCSNTHQKTIEDALSGGTILANVLERLLCFKYISNGSLDKHITEARSDSFTVEVIHGGFFAGYGSNRAYVNGTKVCYDEFDADTWSSLWIDDIIEDIGYESAGRIDVYWLLPGMQINEDGLRLISEDKDALSMILKVKEGHRYLMLFLDHEPARNGVKWDDVVANPVTNLPTVVSPSKKGTVDNAIVQLNDVEGSGAVVRARRKKRSSKQDDDDGEDWGSDSDSDYVPDIVDSDNDIEDGDDDLYQQYADQEPKVDKTIVPEGDVSDDDFFEAAGSDDEAFKCKNLKLFVAEDMSDPKFHTGQIFQSVDQLRRAIREHSCRERKNIKFPKNDKIRLLAECEKGCPWELYASMDGREKALTVKRYTSIHTCESKWNVRAFSAKYIGKYYVEEIRANEKMTLRGLGQLVMKDWGMTPKRGKLGRARKHAFDIIYGDETAQYNQLWDFGQELRRSNPGSTFFMLLDDLGHFKRCYFALDACKREFLAGCRPIIFIDGCHLKTKFGGILLTAIGMDPNDCIFPVAFAVVEVEDTSSWRWFLTALKQDLGIVNTAPWTIMSDKQKGLIKAVKELFPESGHRFCVRHLWQNFNKNFKGEVLKNQLWRCARSSTPAKWQENMDVMLVLSKTAHDWLEEMDPATWTKAFQSEFPKCDVLLNNNCEVFNKYILEARELPILAMIMQIKSQITTRIYNKQLEAESMTGTICPKIRKKLQKHVEWSNICEAKPSGSGIFEIMERGTPYIVDIEKRTCSCRRWDMSGIPCWHAISALRHNQISPESVVAACYSIDRYCKAYENIIWPCRDVKEWEKVDAMPVKAPKIIKKVGRPQKNRRQQPEEKVGKDGKKRMSKHGAVIHCSYCGVAGHNKGGCIDYKLGLVPKKAPNVRAEPQVSDNDVEDVPLVTKEHQLQTMAFFQKDTATYEPEVPSQLLADGPSTQRGPTQFVPLPESSFIQDNVLTQPPTQPTTVTKEGNVLRKRQILAAAKLKEAATRRDIADQAKFDAAMAKLQEDEEKRAQAAEQKKAEALAKKIAAEEKRKAEKEAKLLAAAEKKLALEEKRKKAQEEKQELAEKKKLAQDARKREADVAKENKRLAQAAKQKEAEEARRKEEEEARTRLNNAIAEKMQRAEEQRQKDWFDHLKKQEQSRQEAMSRAHEQSELQRILDWKEKKRLAQEANQAQAANFRAEQHDLLAGIRASQQERRQVREEGSSTFQPYKIPRKTSMFDYLKGPPPGKPGHGNPDAY